VHEDFNLYAVGSKSHTTLMDARTVQCIKKVPSKYTGYGIRSVNFFSSLITIGTGRYEIKIKYFFKEKIDMEVYIVYGNNRFRI